MIWITGNKGFPDGEEGCHDEGGADGGSGIFALSRLITCELNVHTDAPTPMHEIYSELHQNIQDVFNEYGVQIMSPHYETDCQAPTMVPRQSGYRPPAVEPPADRR